LAPETSASHSNLAFTLLALGRPGEVETPARTALRLDGASIHAHCVLGYALANRPETAAEAVTHLHIAARELPHAHFVLAQLYRQTGDTVTARIEIDEHATAAKGVSPSDVEKWKAGLR
jgi:hypothetical protein